MSRRRFGFVVVVVAIAGGGCGGGPVTFQGAAALRVVGEPPSPAAEPAKPPPEPPPRVEVREDKIVISEKIQFDNDQETIKPASFELMNEIVAVILKNPHIKRLRIEGHASSEGRAGHNKRLSARRAKAVMKYLVDKGIAPDLLAAVGYGADKPIADNGTEEGREKNRRVEFNILEQDVTKKKVEVNASGGENVVEENKETVKAPDDSGDEAEKPKKAPKRKKTDKKDDKKDEKGESP
jgi:OOP family OmpA-OmpF porin